MALLIVVGCTSGNQNVARSPAATTSSVISPTAEVSPSPSPVTSPYGMLYDPSSQTNYEISLVGTDGKVAATAAAAIVSQPSCGGVASAPQPFPISASNSRAYFMDSDGIIRFLAPDGLSGKVTSVPRSTASRGTNFAVSPDDRRIAVVIADYTATGASTRLFVEDLNGGTNHINLFSESGSRTLWAVGWHGTNNLVLAVVPSCTQGGGPFCCGMQELHVVDPATATRRFTLGAWAKCPIAGPPSPAGVVCEASPNFTSGKHLNWIAGTVKTLALNGPSAAFVSPGGGMVAFAEPAGTSFTIGAATIPNMAACTWIDETHVMSGGDAQHQPRVADVINGGFVVVAAKGQCGGRLPGGL
jgi:hypothetical protein